MDCCLILRQLATTIVCRRALRGGGLCVLLQRLSVGGPYGVIVELLALTGQRREEVAGLQREELDLAHRVWTIPKQRTKNAKAHVVHLSDQSVAVLKRVDQRGSLPGTKPFKDFSRAKRLLD